MTDEDIRILVRNLQTFIAARFDAFEAHLSGMEQAWVNWARDFGRRAATVEERLQSLEARVASLEGPWLPAHQDFPWRVGRSVGRTIYAVKGSAASKADVLIGVMDTPHLAREAVDCHNQRIGWTEPSIEETE